MSAAMLVCITPPWQVSLNSLTRGWKELSQQHASLISYTSWYEKTFLVLGVSFPEISFLFQQPKVIRSGFFSKACEELAFRVLRSMSPSINLFSKEQTNITWHSLRTFWSLLARADLLLDLSGEEGERKPGEPMDPQSFQSALAG